MGFIKFLIWLERLEFQIGQIYRKFSELFQNDLETSSLFHEISREAFSQSDQAILALKLAIKSGVQFQEMNLNPEHLVAINLELDRVKLFPRRPSLEQALKFALSLESGPDQTALIQSVPQSNPEISGLMRGLDDSRRRHHRALMELALKKKLPVPPDRARPKTESLAA